MKNIFLTLEDIVRFTFYKAKQQLSKELIHRIINLNIFNRLEDKIKKSALQEIKTNGFYVWKDFFSADECSFFISLINDFIAKKYHEVTVYKGFDNRMYGFEVLNSRIDAFLKNKVFLDIFNIYASTGNLRKSHTLAQKTYFKEGNLGSGLGWHVDHTVLKYPKAMVYLCDVDKNNGAFQYINGTHNFFKKINIRLKNDFDFSQNFFSEEEVNRIVENNNLSCSTIEANAGTVILFDGSGIHRGSPLKEKLRYSMTNYYYFGVDGGDDFPLIKKV
jgi:hypothetical protein